MAHILIIDDDDTVRTTFERFLERFGHSVSLAANGREGLRLLRKKKTDLVITDIFMPEADGLEIILEIKKLYRKLSADIPIIAMSSGIRTTDQAPICFLKQAKTFGAARVFSKPVDFNGIHSAIVELLSAERA